jgi:hypothetical protein
LIIGYGKKKSYEKREKGDSVKGKSRGGEVVFNIGLGIRKEAEGERNRRE